MRNRNEWNRINKCVSRELYHAFPVTFPPALRLGEREKQPVCRLNQ